MEANDNSMNSYELIFCSYLSGQVSERQWQSHLKDEMFSQWLAKKAHHHGS